MQVLKLLGRREAWLVVTAVRFLRACVALKDDFYNRHLTKFSLFGPLIDVFLANGNRYNLLNSAVLDLMEFIRRENIKVRCCMDSHPTCLRATLDGQHHAAVCTTQPLTAADRAHCDRVLPTTRVSGLCRHVSLPQDTVRQHACAMCG